MQNTGMINFRQIMTLTSASIRSRYRNSFAGLVWVVLSPMLMFGAQAYAFKLVLNVQVDHYLLFLLTGLLPWIFLSQSISMSTTLFAMNGRLLKSFPIHPFSILASVIIDNLINFFLAFAVLLTGFCLVSPSEVPQHLVLLPLPFVAIFIATLGLTLILATSQVFFADTKFVFDFAIAVAFYITPIFYPVEMVKEPYRSIIQWNPLSILIMPLQALSRAELPPHYFGSVVQSFILSIVCVALAYVVWDRLRNRLYFRL